MDQPTDEDMSGDEELMRRLFAVLGRRRVPNEAAMARAEDEFRQALGPTVRRRKRRRTVTLMALAASVLIAIVVVFSANSPDQTNAGSIARLVSSTGPVEIVGGTPSGVKGAIRAGQSIMTGPTGRAAIRYRDTDVRVDVASTVRFDAARLVLHRGAIYVDTNNISPAPPSVIVETRFGMVGHTGTQFVAKVDADKLTVGLREGGIYVKSSAGDRRDLSAEPGRALIAEVDSSGRVQIRQGLRYGGLWSWVPAASPTYTTEGRSLDEYLAWLAREYGYTVDYADAETRARAETTSIHGDVSGLSIEDAVHAVTATTRVNVTLDPAGTLHVASARDHRSDTRHEGQ